MTLRKAARNTRAILTIEGECARPRAFTHHDLATVHDYYQVPDVSKVDERLKGKGVRLRKLVDLVGPAFHARFLTVESEDGTFSACLPLAETSRTAVVIYELKGKPLDRAEGGPVRFVIPFSGDACGNVKSAARITISEQPGRDTRPSQAAPQAAASARGA